MTERQTTIPPPRPEVAALLHERRFTRFLVLGDDLKRDPDTCAWCRTLRQPLNPPAFATAT